MPNQNIDVTFTALADPTRRAVVEALCGGAATVSQLAAPFDMALPSFTQHLGVLEKAGLIASHREGRTRVCTLNAAALRAVEDWLAAHRRQWEDRLDRFEKHLARTSKDNSNDYRQG